EGQLPEAVEAFERGRKLSYNGPGMTMFLSHALAAQGKGDKATKLYAYLNRPPLSVPTSPWNQMMMTESAPLERLMVIDWDRYKFQRDSNSVESERNRGRGILHFVV